MQTIQTLLAYATQTLGIARLEARLLMSHATGLNAIELLTRDQEPLKPTQITHFKTLVHRREQGEPIAYLVGYREFYSREFLVSPDVLIPRPETEELVERALTWLQIPAQNNLITRVLDLGCGSGVIGLTLALENPILEVTLSDLSLKALAKARQNASRFQTNNTHFVHSNLFEHLPTNPPYRFDLIVSNPPYIPEGDPHLREGDLRFEPQEALTDQQDGLYFYRQIAQQGPEWLTPEGAILVEHGYDQQADVIALFQKAGFNHTEGFKDFAGQPRMVLAQQFKLTESIPSR